MATAQQKQSPPDAELRLRQPPLSSAPQFTVVGRDHADRREVEAYIAEKFFSRYGARIEHFMPELLTLRCNNNISAAVGFRRADDEQLFLEHYLDKPAEQRLSRILGYRLPRTDITELGNLVSTWCGSSQLLLIALTELLYRRGCQWTLFTATPEVSKLLSRLRLEQITLCHADGGRLGEELKNWGSYYDTRPAVTAVNAPLARIVLGDHALTRELLAQCQPLIASALERVA